MTTEEKFRAAVNVIRSLPKNGSYQPSADLMLRFYAYYKQATEGSCKSSRPAFWEMIKKAKWDAWNRLGNMSREEAMDNYVEELKKIVETMSYTENVAQFLESLDSFYERVPHEDLNLLVGNIVERVVGGSGESSPLRPSSPNHSPNRAAAALAARFGSSLETSPASSCYSPSPQPPPSSSDPETEDEDEFIDTIEEGANSTVNVNGNHAMDGNKRGGINSPTRIIFKQHLAEDGLDANHNRRDVISNQTLQPHLIQDQMDENYIKVKGTDIASNSSVVGNSVLKSKAIPNGDVHMAHSDGKLVSDLVGGRICNGQVNGYPEHKPRNGLVNNEVDVDISVIETPVNGVHEEQTAALHIKQLVLDLQSDMDLIKSRLRSLEKLSIAKGHRGADSIVPFSRNKTPVWWPFPELSPGTTAFLVLWPFAAHLLVSYLARRTRSQR